ncbi:LysM peptidoglycan-binding domain-containing protein [Aeromonas sp. sif2416]|uniref:LysM peptidoglycan-binding domain-containing protein n=1 Tax=Aeromonas sp. sif2416 TaxID=2854793 RepID=UPI001C47F2A5|nr:LysM peptidoglycan-binding domain-containing protein [Aeromonas sp. sif2416]MBV7439237.1 LysM peptidoglycan-binding domain-containing protein [Aeromonas sp. sif2416]
MHLKQIILASLATALAGGAMADQLTLKPGYPDSYVVQKGDTLWDISGQYLAEPWLWPRLWNINPQIANPHWIYPGDVLQLSWVNGEPRLGKASQGGKQVIHLSPKNRYENKASPIPTLPLSEIGPFLQTDHILADSQQVKDLPYVLGNNEKHVGMLEGDTLYVRGSLTPGQDYGVYHPGVTYKDRQTGEQLGQEAVFVGTVRAEERLANDSTRVTLTRNRREVYQGDKIIPLPPQESLSAVFMPKAAPTISPGYVVELPSKARGGGKFDVVLINKGLRDRVAPGDVLEIQRPGAEMVDRDGKVSYREYASVYNKAFYSAGKSALPSEAVARVMLFKVYDKLSYGLILQSQEMVSSGYQVTNF